MRTAREERTTQKRTSDVSRSALRPSERVDGFTKWLMDINPSSRQPSLRMWILRGPSRTCTGFDCLCLSKKLILNQASYRLISSSSRHGPATILSERRRKRTCSMPFSGDRWHKPSPPAPATKEADQIIHREMADRRIRVFHATRLVDFDSVRSEGLHPLDHDRQIEFMKSGLVAAGRFTSLRDRLSAGGRRPRR